MDLSKANIVLKNKTGISNFNQVSESEFATLQTMLSERQLSETELATLTKLIPNFVELQKDFIDGLKAAVNKAGESQKSAFDVIDSQMKVLEKLAEGCNTDEARIKIAEILINMSEKTNLIIKEMNDNNNEYWKHIIGSGLVLGIGIVARYLLTNMK